eukprot:4949891-Pleurochrysis_carterae.AAC.1
MSDSESKSTDQPTAMASLLLRAPESESAQLAQSSDAGGDGGKDGGIGCGGNGEYNLSGRGVEDVRRSATRDTGCGVGTREGADTAAWKADDAALSLAYITGE